MRVKSKWFKGEREKTPQEIAGAMAFIVWRIGQNAIRNTRKADFDVAIGEQYFAFLSEFLIFLVQAADRIAYGRLGGDERIAFTTALAKRIAEILADNQGELLGGEAGGHKGSFIERLNLRAGEYAECAYGSGGPSFSFLRYLAHCMRDIVDEKDKNWVIDQMMEIEAPEAVEMVEKAMRGLLGDNSAQDTAGAK